MMNRMGLDLCLFLILAVDLMTLLDPNANGELAFAILIVNTLIVLLYVSFVVAPHYIKRIYNDDLRHLLHNMALLIPICLFLILLTSSGHIDLDDPIKAKNTMLLYILIGSTIIVAVKGIASYCYHKKKEKEMA